MSGSAWIALGGMAFSLLLQAMVGGYFIGRLSQRVEGLETAGEGHADLAVALARLEATVSAELRHQAERLAELRRDLLRRRGEEVRSPS